MSNNRHDELFALADAFCRDELTALEQARLEELVTGDEDLRRLYVRYVHMHVCLRRAFEAQGSGLSDRGAEEQDQVVASSSAPLQAASRSRETAARSEQPVGSEMSARHKIVIASRRPRVRLWAASLLLLAGLAGLTFWLTRTTTQPTPEEFVATLTDLVGRPWDASRAPQKGDRLQTGRLEISAGMAEITFAGGAVMLVEAPAILELTGPARGYLHSGRVVVRVPPASSGFVMDTDRARLVDHGTEFGVGVGNGGDTLVQVFDGVVVADLKEAAQVESQRILAGESLQIDAGSKPRPVASVPQRFVRRFPDPKERGKDMAMPYNESRYDALHIVPAVRPPKIDGDLSDWDRSGGFFVACAAPYIRDYYVQGAMMYDAKHLYIGAHVGDPSPMCSVIDPKTDPTFGWKGGAVQVRLCTDRTLGWPVDGEAPIVRNRQPARPQDRNNKLLHLTMWYYEPGRQPCLHIAHGMDFHSDMVNPPQAHGAFRKDADGRGYTLEYAIPWELLACGSDPPRGGDELAACWNVLWSDDDGRLWKGLLVDGLNPHEKGFTYQRAQTWGRAIYHKTGNLAPGTVVPRY
jgi:hypothetical protein